MILIINDNDTLRVCIICIHQRVKITYCTISGRDDSGPDSGEALSSVEAYYTHEGGEWRAWPEMRVARKKHGCAAFTAADRSTVRQKIKHYRTIFY